jgi:ABC-type amino acid transport substrate-binding protein
MPDSKKRPVIFAAVLLLALLVTGGDPAGAQTLRAVKERGTLNCGVSQGLLGFSSMDDKNVWTGLDVDICRAVAAAIFGIGTQADIGAAINASDVSAPTAGMFHHLGDLFFVGAELWLAAKFARS